MPGGLIEGLSEWKARLRTANPAQPVLSTRTGSRQTVTNIDHRLKATIRAANRQLSKLGIEPISERVSPHSLRRTYASMRAALRDDPVYIAEQLGHENPEFTFRVYQRAAKRRERLSGKLLDQFDRGLQWAEIGRIAALPSAKVEEVDRPPSPNPLDKAENTHSGR
jgi:integrase